MRICQCPMKGLCKIRELDLCQIKEDIIAGIISPLAFGHRKVVGLAGATGPGGGMSRPFKRLVGLGSMAEY